MQALDDDYVNDFHNTWANPEVVHMVLWHVYYGFMPIFAALNAKKHSLCITIQHKERVK